MARLTRSEKRELTTAQLFETAKAVFLDRGYHRSTLDDIADAAGFTKGAVYARFASKDDLFLALYDQRQQEIAAAFNPGHNYKTFEEFALDDARHLIALRRNESEWYLLLLEFWTYAVRDPRLRREFAARHNQALARVAGRIEAVAARLGVKLRLPALDMARAASAMSQGYTLERLADPVGVPETLLESMFAMPAHEASGAAHRKRHSPERKVGDGKTSPIVRRKKDGNAYQLAGAKVR